MGSAATLAEAFKKAYDADPVSIYGGIVAANREIDKATAEIMSPVFLEVIGRSFLLGRSVGDLLEKEKFEIITGVQY